MTITRDWIDDLIDRIYEAALSPPAWEAVLALAGERVGATGGTVFWADGGGFHLRRSAQWNLDPEVVDLYERQLIAICPRMRASLGLQAGEVLDDRPLRDSARPTIRDYYEVSDRLGLGHAWTLLAESSPDLRLCLNLLEPGTAESDTEAQQLLTLIAPHVRRAGTMTLQMAEMADRAAFGDSLYERGDAMILLDRTGRVCRTNSAADAILSRGDGLRLAGGHLRGARAEDDARLGREIGAALEAAAGRPPPEGFALLGRPSGAPAWAVSALPVASRLREGSAQVLVTVAETVPRLRPEALRRGFGLSGAEAEIAVALVGGRSPEEIAEARRATIGTVRSQLKGIFAKMEVSSQAQLVGRVAASLRVLPRADLRPDGRSPT